MTSNENETASNFDNAPEDAGESYEDEKGRTRWRANDALAAQLQVLHDTLVIGGYDPSHAARYPRLGYAISRHYESVRVLHREKRLRELSGVGLTIEKILSELLETGTTAKITEPSPESGYTPPPAEVLEMLTLPRLGAATVRSLWAEHNIGSVATLHEALEAGRLQGVKGTGPALKKAVRERLGVPDKAPTAAKRSPRKPKTEPEIESGTGAATTPSE